MTPDDFLRFCEKTLDIHHQSLPFWKRTGAEATYALFAAYDSFFLTHPQIMGSSLSFGIAQMLKAMEGGFNQALRWHLAREQSAASTSHSDSRAIEDAGAFILDSMHYFEIAYFHRTYGAGGCGLEVDSHANRIRFVPRANEQAWRGVMGFGERIASHRASALDESQEERRQIIHRGNSVLRAVRHHLDCGHVVLDDFAFLENPNVKQLLKQTYLSDTASLPPDTDLGGMTLDQYDRFWLAVAGISISALLLYRDHVNKGVSQEACMPTQLYKRPFFTNSLAQVTKLDPIQIDQIIDRLSINPTARNTDVFLQPFLATTSTIAWSAHAAQSNRHRRNILKLMARSSAFSRLASNLIGQRERPMQAHLGHLLATQGGWSFKLMTKLSAGHAAEIDLLGYSNAYPSEVLIVEGKAVLDVDDVLEIRSATEEMIHGQSQLRRAIEALKRLPIGEKRQMFPFVDWSHVKEYFPLVVTIGSEPGASYDFSEIPGIAIDTLEFRLRRSSFRSPARLWKACRDRPWLVPFGDRQIRYEATSIGSITYELPVFDTQNVPGQ
jgi:hypothetical protein